jgi:hypothetical protein
LIVVAVRQTPSQQIEMPTSSDRRKYFVRMVNRPPALSATSPTSVIKPVNIA